MSRIKTYFVFLYHCFLAILNIYLFDCIFSLGFVDSFLAIGPAAIPIVMGLMKLGTAYQQKQLAKGALEDATAEAIKLGKDIEKRKFINRYEALQAPTTGTKLQMEQVQRSAQSAVEAAREGGQRAVIGGTGRIQQGVTDASAKIAARLDDIQLKLDDKFLSEEQRIGIMNEKKDLQLQYQRLAGAQGAATAAGNQIAQANSDMMSAAGGIVSGGIQASALYSGGSGGGIPEGTTIQTDAMGNEVSVAPGVTLQPPSTPPPAVDPTSGVDISGLSMSQGGGSVSSVVPGSADITALSTTPNLNSLNAASPVSALQSNDPSGYNISPNDPRYTPQYDPNNALYIAPEFRVFGMDNVPVDQRTLPQYQ
tara:strand:- start:1891 stop:2988 length:1098 start_codon:yes stop_codon:yes gene_type:complete